MGPAWNQTVGAAGGVAKGVSLASSDPHPPPHRTPAGGRRAGPPSPCPANAWSEGHNRACPGPLHWRQTRACQGNGSWGLGSAFCETSAWKWSWQIFGFRSNWVFTSLKAGWERAFSRWKQKADNLENFYTQAGTYHCRGAPRGVAQRADGCPSPWPLQV